MVAFQCDVHRVARSGRCAEDLQAVTGHPELADVVAQPASVHGVRGSRTAGECVDHRRSADGQLRFGGEDDRLTRLGAHRRDFCSLRDGHIGWLRGGEIEGYWGSGCAGRLEADADQLEELDVELVRYLVDSV